MIERLRAATYPQYVANPTGAYVLGQGWIYFCLSAELYGYAVYGAPTHSAIEQLVAFLKKEGARNQVEHDVLAHLGLLSGTDPLAFEALARFVSTESEQLKIVRRAALVHPPGLNGAIVSGFFTVVSPPFPTSSFSDGVQALASLGHHDPQAANAQLCATLDDLAGTPSIVSRLRAFVEGHPHSPTVSEAAASLGLAERSMQRRLTESQTSFSRELQKARLAKAAKVLRFSSDSISSVAHSLGFTSSQHFSRLFKAEFGVTPTEYRQRADGC